MYGEEDASDFRHVMLSELARQGHRSQRIRSHRDSKEGRTPARRFWCKNQAHKGVSCSGEYDGGHEGNLERTTRRVHLQDLRSLGIGAHAHTMYLPFALIRCFVQLLRAVAELEPIGADLCRSFYVLVLSGPHHVCAQLSRTRLFRMALY